MITLIYFENLFYTLIQDIQAIHKDTIASKINITPKGVYLPISKLHSILAVVNLIAHNNISQICYCGQISLQSAAVNCSFSDNLTHEVSFILLAMVPASYEPLHPLATIKAHKRIVWTAFLILIWLGNSNF